MMLEKQIAAFDKGLEEEKVEAAKRKEQIQKFLRGCAFQQSTLDLLNDKNLEKLGRQYGFREGVE